MKIAQLTFHASHNYGSVLQAYALSKQLQLMGHSTEFINLRPESQKRAYQVITGRGVHRVFHYLIYPQLKRRYDEYERFITEVLPITKDEYGSTKDIEQVSFDYDAYVCGGDQIWNPVCQDFETAYYLQFLPENCRAKKISYSPSLGRTEFKAATLENISHWVQKFDAISVREQRGAELIERVSNRKVVMVCDPVLLLDKQKWEKIAKKPKYKKPYVLVYFLENNHGSRDLIGYLKETLGYDVVLLNEYLRDFFKPYRHAYDSSPEEFVGLFMNASFIYTNSFHGTAFATLFEKPFITAIALDQEHAINNNDSRKIDYLNKLGLEYCIYTEEKPNLDLISKIDYKKISSIISSMRKDSINYLFHALK